jgi:hypothetical protein
MTSPRAVCRAAKLFAERFVSAGLCEIIPKEYLFLPVLLLRTSGCPAA